MKRYILLIKFTLLFFLIQAQTLGLKDFLKTVYQNHPDAVSARLLLEEAEANQKMARGGFDPKIFASNQEKNFGGTHYYSKVESGLTIPLNPGIDINAGLNFSSGLYLNPDERIPLTGLGAFGIDANLGKGLFFDERRFNLQSADLGILFNDARKIAVINDLILDAAQAYFNWTFQFNTYKAYQLAVDLADQRFKAIRESYLFGDMAAADTLEAFLEFQNRLNLRTLAEINYQNSTFDLNFYIWDQNQSVQRLDPGLIPENYSESNFFNLPLTSTISDFILINHPDLVQIGIQRSQLDLERKLALEGFKPDLKLKYRYLLNSNQISDVTTALAENINWGLQFNFPLFLRQARGKMDGIKVKNAQNDLKEIAKLNELTFKTEAFLSEKENLKKQLELFREVVANHQRLVQIENRKFQIGESSLFLINNREAKLIEAQINLAKIEYQLGVLEFKMLWAIGKVSEIVSTF
ncbi:MAG: hypothetical protein RJA52_435 [Bacteroidota bacterium]